MEEDVKDILLWMKLLNFLLYYWNEVRIFKVVSCVGMFIAVDNLIASNSRITFV